MYFLYSLVLQPEKNVKQKVDYKTDLYLNPLFPF